jgi:hypothetical protein
MNATGNIDRAGQKVQALTGSAKTGITTRVSNEARPATDGPATRTKGPPEYSLRSAIRQFTD